ncbi:AAA family ATPase [Aerococcus urinaeequi]|uniref:AAA family ATPase n=1 Tax=Aerococcus urinaeequi TaxID=51665 RepID=UPI0008460B04|nr:AAA family ATPase [Aerococcus urinaeequi]
MQIKLLKMTIRNFKGIQAYELTPEGETVNVQGDNGTGKTTLYDAFLWALFGKNSADQSDSKFDWKPLDSQGNELHHLETEVEITLDIDGQEKKLSRMISENWTKKRGSIEETFSGHKTTFKIDDLSVKKKEYTDYLDDLIGEERFKLLTNVNYFPEVLDWKKRREVLIEMVGDITDADVIATNNDLKPLTELLKGKSAEELMKLTKQQMKQANEDIEALPSRIDEVDRSLPDLTGLDREQLQEDEYAKERLISQYQEDILNIKNGDGQSKLKNNLANKQLEYREALADYNDKQKEEVSGFEEMLQAKQSERNELTNKLSTAKNKLTENEFEIKNNNSQLETLVYEKDQLSKQFFEVRDKTMASFDEHRTTCKMCGQELPADQIEEIKANYQKEVEAFNQDKAAKLEDIQVRGKEKAEQIKECEAKVEIIEQQKSDIISEIKKLTEAISELDKSITGIQGEIKAINDDQTPFEDTEHGKQLTKEGQKIQAKIAAGSEAYEEDIKLLNEKIDIAKAELVIINDNLYKFTAYANQSKRKQELIDSEKEISAHYGQLETQLYLLEEFTRSKVNLLTDAINDKFKFVQFKLFEENINGGLEEICEPTVDGNNYSTGLNNAARINAGLDIINTLMDYYQTKVPVFIDNAEGINEIIDIDTQLITLSVSKHKNLNVTTL